MNIKKIDYRKNLLPISINKLDSYKNNANNIFLKLLRRLASILLFLQGMHFWKIIILTGNSNNFINLPIEYQIKVILFAIFSFIISLGLWLNANWGYIFWIITLIINIFTITKFENNIYYNSYYIFNIVLILLYTSAVLYDSIKHYQEKLLNKYSNKLNYFE